MTKYRLTMAVSAIFLLSGCAAAPAATETTGTTAMPAESAPEVASFASYIQGDWSCDKDSPDHFDAGLKLPVLGVSSLDESEISIGDGTWSATWGSTEKAEGTWKIDGREILITSPLGTQSIGNLPETPDQAIEPMKLRIADTKNGVTLQVKGERTVTIMSSKGYVSDCTKF
jgi:hypothetical protein